VQFAVRNEVDAANALALFVSERLFEAGVWRSARASDGVAAYRVVLLTGESARLKGRIWLVADQTQKTFWLDLEEANRSSEFIRWTLYFDISSFGRGRERNLLTAFEVLDAPENAVWRTTLSGLAIQNTGQFIPQA